jgi:hypothetical protein
MTIRTRWLLRGLLVVAVGWVVCLACLAAMLACRPNVHFGETVHAK